MRALKGQHTTTRNVGEPRGLMPALLVSPAGAPRPRPPPPPGLAEAPARPEFDHAAVPAMTAAETRTPKRWTLLVWSSPTSLVLHCWLPGSPKCHPLALLSVSEHETRGSSTRPERWQLLPRGRRSSSKPAPARSTGTLQNHLPCFNYTFRALLKELCSVFMCLNKHTKHELLKCSICV